MQSADTRQPAKAAGDGPALAGSHRGPDRTRIKICGLRTASDVDAAVNAGADAIGLVFYEKSPRHVTLKEAAALAARLPPFVSAVGLFVNAELASVQAACSAIPGLVLQFHGDETAEQCDAAEARYLRSAPVTPGFDLLKFAAMYPDALAILLDAHVDGYGGGGKVFDWSLIAHDVDVPLVLSGGLHAENVSEGIARLRPWAVDVSSGVESSRGVKDPAAITRFCRAVRAADALIANAV